MLSKQSNVFPIKVWCLHSLTWQINIRQCCFGSFSLWFLQIPLVAPQIQSTDTKLEHAAECLGFEVQSPFKLLPPTVIWSCPRTKLPLILKYTFLCSEKMSHDSKKVLMWPNEKGLQSGPDVLPMSGACPGATLLGLRINWHWVSGGRHWSSSSTPGQSVGLVGSLPAPPPSPPPLLPPSRMWLILMLKGNSWPEWEVRVQRLEVMDLVCDVEPKLIKIRAELVPWGDESAVWSWDGRNSVWTTQQKIMVTEGHGNTAVTKN